MLWHCHRKAMKLAAYVTIHENSYICADIIYYGEFSRLLLPQKLSNSHEACSGHKCEHHSFATTFVWNVFHPINTVSYTQGTCRNVCSHPVRYLPPTHCFSVHLISINLLLFQSMHNTTYITLKH